MTAEDGRYRVPMTADLEPLGDNWRGEWDAQAEAANDEIDRLWEGEETCATELRRLDLQQREEIVTLRNRVAYLQDALAHEAGRYLNQMMLRERAEHTTAQADRQLHGQVRGNAKLLAQLKAQGAAMRAAGLHDRPLNFPDDSERALESVDPPKGEGVSEEQAKKIVEGVQSFAEEMRAKNIHVGMGANPVCVTCGEAWPCAASGESVDPETAEK